MIECSGNGTYTVAEVVECIQGYWNIYEEFADNSLNLLFDHLQFLRNDNGKLSYVRHFSSSIRKDHV